MLMYTGMWYLWDHNLGIYSSPYRNPSFLHVPEHLDEAITAMGSASPCYEGQHRLEIHGGVTEVQMKLQQDLKGLALRKTDVEPEKEPLVYRLLYCCEGPPFRLGLAVAKARSVFWDPCYRLLETPTSCLLSWHSFTKDMSLLWVVNR